MNEVIPLTGTFFSGTFYTKKYINLVSGSAVSGGFWETIFDGAPTSISSSALVDLTYGISVSSSLSSYTQTYLKEEKQRVYKEMAGHLLGDKKGLFLFNNVRLDDLFFLVFKRRIYKDEISKGNTTITLQVSGTTLNDTLQLTDTGAATSFTVGQAGDEAPLYSGSTQVGKMYYNAGIAVFATGVFVSPTNGSSIYWSGSTASRMDLNQLSVCGSIDHVVDGFKNRVLQVNFHNQTNLHSTIYFCRALHDEFNYSSNPTFIDAEGRIIPTSGTDNQTRTYLTTIGLYDIQDNILGVAKMSEPVKKGPDNEVTVRVRLSY